MKSKKQVRGTTLTEENVFKKPRYREILYLIVNFEKNNKGIREKQLVQILVKKNHSDYELQQIKKNFVSTDIKLLEDFEKVYEKEMITKEELEYAKKKYSERHEKYKKAAFEKFESVYALRRALQRLKKLGLIISVKPNKGYSYLVLTDKGFILYYKYLIKHGIENINNVTLLLQINLIVLEAIYLEKKNKVT